VKTKQSQTLFFIKSCF